MTQNKCKWAVVIETDSWANYVTQCGKYVDHRAEPRPDTCPHCQKEVIDA